MKRMILLAFVLLLTSSRLIAQLPPKGYIGLFADDSHSEWCVTSTGGFYPFTMWIWCLPSERGQMCVEFGISYPTNVIQSTVMVNEDLVKIPPPDWECPYFVCYWECQYDWHWVFRQDLFLTDVSKSYIGIVGNPCEPHLLDFANCEPGYPTEPCIVYTNLYLNYGSNEPECSGTPIRSTSWGAIKSLFDRQD